METHAARSPQFESDGSQLACRHLDEGGRPILARQSTGTLNAAPNKAMRDDIDLHLAKRVFHRRRELNLTQRQLGQLCGVTFQQVQKYECGANRISASMIWRLADALDVGVHYFYDGLEKQHLNGSSVEVVKPTDAKTSQRLVRTREASSS